MSLPVSRCRSLPATLAALVVGGLLTGCGASHDVPSGGALDVSVNEWRVTPGTTDASPGTLLIVVHNGADGAVLGDASFSGANPRKLAEANPGHMHRGHDLWNFSLKFLCES